MPWTSTKRSVLVPHDLSPVANRAVSTALTFVEDPRHVAALHVVEPLSSFVTMSDPKNREAQENLEGTLGELRAALDEAGLGNVAAHVRFGDAAQEVAGFVEEYGVELVVMPSSRRSGVKRLLLGSVAEAILRRVPCPILLLRADEED
jgi:nucleotide-binding universal stress UspA family protein